MGARWYIGCKSAEGDAWFPIELSESEVKAVRKFVEAQSGSVGEPFSSYFSLLDEDFEAKEEADAYICENFLD